MGRPVEVLETVVGLAIVLVVGFAIPDQWGLLHLQPHPLWIVVLAIALRYGAPTGYLASGLAALAYGLLFWLRPDARLQPIAVDDLLRPLVLLTHLQPITAHDLIQPFLLFAGGAVLSEARRAQRQREGRMQERLAGAQAVLNEISQRHQATLEVNAELAQQIAGQSASVVTLYEAAKELETLDVGGAYRAAVNLVAKFLEVDACALYVLCDGQLRLQAGRPEGRPGRPQTLDLRTGLVGQVIRDGEVVTIRDRLLQGGLTALLDEPIMMAGPLRGRNGDLAGLVVVERLPFLKLTPTRVRLFGLILDWASTVVQNALMFEAARDRSADDEEAWAYSAGHAVKRLGDEMMRALRYQLPLSVVLVEVSALSAGMPGVATRPPPDEVVAGSFRRCLRRVDFAGHHPDPGQLLLILPATTLKGAKAAIARIHDDLQRNVLPWGADGQIVSVRFGIATRGPDVTSPEEILTHALADLESVPSRGLVPEEA